MQRKVVLTSIVLIVPLAGVLIAGAAEFPGLFRWPFHREPATLHLPGVVETQEVRLGSKIAGRVAEVYVKEGQLVDTGDKLVLFAEPELKAQLGQQEAKVQAAQAEWEKAWNGPRPEDIRVGESDLRSAEADEKLAEQNFARTELLYQRGGGAATRQEYDQALASLRSAQARRATARAKLDLLHAGTRQEEIAAADARLMEARAKLDEIKANLAEALVSAPEPCVIEVLGVRKGDLVQPNQPILRVLRAVDLWVKVYVPETELGKIRRGQEVEVTIDAYPGERFPGIVEQIASISEFTPRNVQSADEREHQVFGVKVRVNNERGIFKSGMAAEVWLPLQGAR
jgi:multidrug resistance efflux pump